MCSLACREAAASLIRTAPLSPRKRRKDADDRCWQQAAVSIQLSTSLRNGKTLHSMTLSPSSRKQMKKLCSKQSLSIYLLWQFSSSNSVQKLYLWWHCMHSDNWGQPHSTVNGEQSWKSTAILQIIANYNRHRCLISVFGLITVLGIGADSKVEHSI